VATRTSEAARTPPATGRSYGAGARILSVGLACTGLATFAYFALASHELAPVDYKQLSLLWAVVFVIVSIIYRPIEQLLSRTIAERRARGLRSGHPLRVPAALQVSFAAIFLAVVLALHDRVADGLFDGAHALYWVLVAGVLAYAGSYFARGWLAGHQRFGLYGGLVALEAGSRLCFALAVTIGIASGRSAVAIGIAAGPLVSLVVVPAALGHRRRRRRAAAGAWLTPTADAALEGPAAEGAEELNAPGGDGLSLRRGGRFALAVLAIMAAEQALLNGSILSIDLTVGGRALAGFVFNVMLITRAPLQLFQAIQTSLLPHLTGLATGARPDAEQSFQRTVRVTLVAIACFAVLVALCLLAVGPPVMHLLFGAHFDYGRGGLALMGLAMGGHLASGTLNQSALARGRAGAAAGAWALAAAAFMVWTVVPVISGAVLRVEVGYLGATLLLAGALYALHRRPDRARVAPAMA
jgi:O-antigen/teichoic acid export membrane protein